PRSRRVSIAAHRLSRQPAGRRSQEEAHDADPEAGGRGRKAVMDRNRCRARMPERQPRGASMRIHWFRSVLLIAAAGIAVSAWSPVRAGDLIVDLGKAVDISMVGAVQRWDEEGKPRFPVDPKAKIAEPRVNARAVRQGSGK